MTTARADHIAAMRERIVTFLADQTGSVDKAAIKEHLGLEPLKWNGWLEQALKSRRIHVSDGLYSTAGQMALAGRDTQ